RSDCAVHYDPGRLAVMDKLERAKGIEPSYEAWEASVLPLNYARFARSLKKRGMAGEEGLEPPTPGFGDRCSNQLSYTPTERRSCRNPRADARWMRFSPRLDFAASPRQFPRAAPLPPVRLAARTGCAPISASKRRSPTSTPASMNCAPSRKKAI